MKNIVNFETKLIEYGIILREYDEVEALCKEAGWTNNALNNRLTEVSRRLDRVTGPLNTLMKKLAKEIV